MKFRLELTGEVVEVLKSIDTSLRYLANRSPKPLAVAPEPIATKPKVRKHKAGVERLSVASPEEVAKLELIAYCREQGLDINEKDVDIRAITREY